MIKLNKMQNYSYNCHKKFSQYSKKKEVISKRAKTMKEAEEKYCNRKFVKYKWFSSRRANRRADFKIKMKKKIKIIKKAKEKLCTRIPLINKSYVSQY